MLKNSLTQLYIFLIPAFLFTGGCSLEKPVSKADNSSPAYYTNTGGTPSVAAAGVGSPSETAVPVVISKLSGFAGTGTGSAENKTGKPSLQAPVSSTPGDFAFGVVEAFSLDGTILASAIADDVGAFSLDVPVGTNYFIKVTSENGLSEVRGYIASVDWTGISNIAIDSFSSSVVYALERYIEIPDVILGYTGSANIRSVAENMAVHSQIDALSNLVQVEIVAGNAAGLTTATLDFLVANFTNTPPLIQIDEPLDGKEFSECELLVLRASASDAEDGRLYGSSLVWSSGPSEVIGEGEVVVTSALTPGTYTISVTASDIGAKSSTYSINVTINASAGGWCSVSAGGVHSLAIKGDETLWGWGHFGTFNDGSSVFFNSPVQISTDTDWRSTAISDSTAFAIKLDGSLWTWGDGNNFAILPSRFDDANDWLTISAGLRHHVGRKYDGSIWAWGENSQGQLGDGTNLSRNTPVMVGVGRDWLEVSAGYSHTVALKSNGSIWTWGANDKGQLGDGTGFSRRFPAQVGNGFDWVSVSSSGDHNLALKGDGTIWAWGGDLHCQLGTGCGGDRNFPVRVSMDSDWVSVFAGPMNSFAIKADGTLWGWGMNNTGQLGDILGYNFPGATTIMAPGRIGTASDWVDLSPGSSHTIAIKTDGTVVAWGRFQGTDGGPTTIF